MKPPSDSTPAMISVVVVSSTSLSSRRSPSISASAKLEIKSLRGAARRMAITLLAYSFIQLKAAICSGPLARVRASDCTISTALSRTICSSTMASSPIGRPSAAINTLTVNLDDTSLKSNCLRPLHSANTSLAMARMGSSKASRLRFMKACWIRPRRRSCFGGSELPRVAPARPGSSVIRLPLADE